jgi:sugar/nucleoside kinase (ribokinase family)
MSLIEVGTVAFDAIETPFGKRDKVVGGACTYIALAASYFIPESNLVSVVGDDFPTEMLDEMTKRGISLEGLQIKKGEKSFFWAGKYHYDMNTRDTLVTDLNVLADFNPKIPSSYQGSEFLMLGNLAPAVQKSVLQQLTSRPKLVVLDTMNFWMDNTPEELNDVIALCDVLTINDEEARQLSGEHSLVKAARKIFNMGPKYLIVKKGEHGALLFHKDQVFFAPALPLEDVIDPTGAGDTFAGGFIGHLTKTGDISFDSMKRAVIVGSAMASFTCEAFGPERLLSLTQREIGERIRQFVNLVGFDVELVN